FPPYCRDPPASPLFPYTTLFRSSCRPGWPGLRPCGPRPSAGCRGRPSRPPDEVEAAGGLQDVVSGGHDVLGRHQAVGVEVAHLAGLGRRGELSDAVGSGRVLGDRTHQRELGQQPVQQDGRGRGDGGSVARVIGTRERARRMLRSHQGTLQKILVVRPWPAVESLSWGRPIWLALPVESAGEAARGWSPLTASRPS